MAATAPSSFTSTRTSKPSLTGRGGRLHYAGQACISVQLLSFTNRVLEPQGEAARGHPAALACGDPATMVFSLGPSSTMSHRPRERFPLRPAGRRFHRLTRAVWRCYNEIPVGAVIHNDGATFRVDLMPYGCVKDSGLGREALRYAIEEHSERRLLALNP